MQTTPQFVSFGTQQGNYVQGPFSQHHLFEPSATFQQPSQSCPGVNPWQTSTTNQLNFPIHGQHSQSNNYPILPRNIVEQIRSCTNGTTPIFILPSSCHQMTHHQPPSASTVTNGMTAQLSPAFPFCHSPTFLPYPFPMPIYDSLGLQNATKANSQRCDCCARKVVDFNANVDSARNCCYEVESEKHQCVQGSDETICGKKNCPSALNLQALVSQLLAVQGIIACAATRLILRKIPGSNITTPMEETMEKAKRSLSSLTKDQLLTESRNGQQVNALINLHITANPPANVVPILTLVQLKMNLLKAQVESLLNGKLMENQGMGVEETSIMDPMVLALKTDAELREFLSALRQKECNERVNVSFAPYRSQKVIAETRLSNVQSKISQVEAEMDRRRATSLQGSQRINQSYDPYETAGNRHRGIGIRVNGYPQSLTHESPDPFAMSVRSPRRLNLKPHVGSPCTTYDRPKTIDARDNSSTTTEETAKTCIDTATGPDVQKQTPCRGKTDESPQRTSSSENCSCEDQSSDDESDRESKKKLHEKVNGEGKRVVRKYEENVETGSANETSGATFKRKTVELPTTGNHVKNSEMEDTLTALSMDNGEIARGKGEVPEKDVIQRVNEDEGETTTKGEDDIEGRDVEVAARDENQDFEKFQTSKTMWLTENEIGREGPDEEDSPTGNGTDQSQRVYRTSLLLTRQRKITETRADQEPSTSDERKNRKGFKESNASLIPRGNGNKEKSTNGQREKRRTSFNGAHSPSNQNNRFK